MEKASKLNIPLYRLDLTLRDFYQPKFAQYWQTLRKRIARHYRIKLHYAGVKALGEQGSKLHKHLVYWVSTLNGKPIYDLKRAWINKYWLSRQWQEITGSKVTYIKTVKGQLKDRKRVSNYLISQYFSGKNDYERMSYSRAWLFVGAGTIWKLYFAPNYMENPSATLDSWLHLLTHSTDLATLPGG